MRARAMMTVAVMMLLAGCATSGQAGDGGDPEPTVAPECAETLAAPTGGAEAAAAAPDVGEFDSAWLCVYAIGEGWTLAEGPASIEDLEGLRGIVDAIEPADMTRPCTMELGPEYLLTLADGEDLTRIVVDDYGCRWVRIEGTDGLLAGPEGIIQDLSALAGL